MYRATTGGADGFEKDIVIKRILPIHSGNNLFTKMFVDEARIAARLQHPNIVQVFDFDQVDGVYYLAMEYVHGADLSSVMEATANSGENLDLSESLYIVGEIAKALDYAHRRKHRGRPLDIVHRDVSPHNLLISFEGEVKLTDFGIAKAAERLTQTRDGIVKGKTAYMSPEQARGERLDPRSDLFSLGTVLFELATMRRLFVGGSEREVFLKVMNANVPSPRTYNSRLPVDVEQIIMTLLKRFPERRYPNAAELIPDLRRAYRGLAEEPAEMSLSRRLNRLFPNRSKMTSGEWSLSGTPVSPKKPAPPSTPVQVQRAQVYPLQQRDPASSTRLLSRTPANVSIPDFPPSLPPLPRSASSKARGVGPSKPPAADSHKPGSRQKRAKIRVRNRQSVVSMKQESGGLELFTGRTQVSGRSEEGSSTSPGSPLSRNRYIIVWVLGFIILVLSLILVLLVALAH